MIAERLRPILEAEYPRFSRDEMARRRRAVEGLLGEAGCDHLMLCGANLFGSAVQRLTGWQKPKIEDAIELGAVAIPEEKQPKACRAGALIGVPGSGAVASGFAMQPIYGADSCSANQSALCARQR